MQCVDLDSVYQPFPTVRGTCRLAWKKNLQVGLFRDIRKVNQVSESEVRTRCPDFILTVDAPTK